MKDLIQYIVQNIVSKPEEVKIEEIVNEESDNRKSVIYTIQAHQDDIGVIIGKSGQTIKSIRSISKIKAIKDGYYVDVKVEESERPE